MDIPYVLFETDAVWLRDPMEFFVNQTLIDDADVVVPRKGCSVLFVKLKNGLFQRQNIVPFSHPASLLLLGSQSLRVYLWLEV